MEIPQTSSRTVPVARARFPRPARLLRTGDFDHVYREGQRHFGRDVTVFWMMRGVGEGARGTQTSVELKPRVGFTVGRAVGGAVQRNRVKRRLREAARMNLNFLPPAVDVVLNARKSALDAAFQQLLGQVAEAFRAIAQQALRAPARKEQP